MDSQWQGQKLIDGSPTIEILDARLAEKGNYMGLLLLLLLLLILFGGGAFVLTNNLVLVIVIVLVVLALGGFGGRGRWSR